MGCALLPNTDSMLCPTMYESSTLALLKWLKKTCDHSICYVAMVTKVGHGFIEKFAKNGQIWPFYGSTGIFDIWNHNKYVKFY